MKKRLRKKINKNRRLKDDFKRATTTIDFPGIPNEWKVEKGNWIIMSK